MAAVAVRENKEWSTKAQLHNEANATVVLFRRESVSQGPGIFTNIVISVEDGVSLTGCSRMSQRRAGDG